MSIDKIQEIEKVIRNNASALICPKCGGGGTGAYKGEGQKRCQECNGEGLVDWNYGDAPEKISDLISQAEARGRESVVEMIMDKVEWMLPAQRIRTGVKVEPLVKKSDVLDLLTKLKDKHGNDN